MKIRYALLSALSCSFALGEEEKPPVVKTKIIDGKTVAILPLPKEEPATEKIDLTDPTKLPAVDAAIPAAVKAMGEPSMVELPAGATNAVSGISEKVQAHVNQGIFHLHGGWEFEASRHFAAAMREDPECLLAHWGMVMTMLAPSSETGAARDAAAERLLYLVDQQKGTELERGLAYGLIKYMQEGPAGAAEAFRRIAEKFPNDIQANIFGALFSRTGYDEFGHAKLEQETAEKNLLTLSEKHPDNPLPLYALLSIRAEATDLTASLEMARKLRQMMPDYAPYFHLLGHYEWRCGNHAKAISAFGNAATFYEQWMKENKVTLADCPEWVKAECYRVVAMASKGDYDTALAAARQIANVPFPENRMTSPGVRMLLWEAKTLPASIILHRNAPGCEQEAADSLPKPASIKNTHQHSLAYLWIDGLRLHIEAQKLIRAKRHDEAKEVVMAIARHGEHLSSGSRTAAANGERSAWFKAFKTLEILASDLNGQVAFYGPRENIGSAYNWFSAAADRQRPASLMLPPLIFTPMASHLGEYYLAIAKPTEAIDAFKRALTAFPNDLRSFIGLKKAYEKAKLTQEATDTEARIQAIKAE